MTQYNKATLKTFFAQNDVPQGTDYANFIDSYVNQVETATQTINGPIQPTELDTARVSAGNVNVTGTLTIAGQVSAKVNVTVSSLTITGNTSANTLNISGQTSANGINIAGHLIRPVTTFAATGTAQASGRG